MRLRQARLCALVALLLFLPEWEFTAPTQMVVISKDRNEEHCGDCPWDNARHLLWCITGTAPGEEEREPGAKQCQHWEKKLIPSRPSFEDLLQYSSRQEACITFKMLKKTCVLLALAAVLTTMLGPVNCDDDDDDGDDDDHKRCGENMVFSPCGGSCQKTCQIISNVGTAEKCTEQCKPGCSCQHGYVLQNRKCIPAKECTCPSNAEYRDCGGACPFTCQDVAKNITSKVCTMQCKIGCFCKEGYVLNSNECVLKKDCPLQ
ncbi:hypothetical protein NDU88_010469 [Pleurodeles waltl]|uniref:TIL domain-containing protein n=1 Tax=Pleurodeles waltl TaxID=8319 RepID=A0AAV7PUY5_PLEWA|nr:hypothetical protein NDU88_010469 [Pleurodeles waltl]